VIMDALFQPLPMAALKIVALRWAAFFAQELHAQYVSQSDASEDAPQWLLREAALSPTPDYRAKASGHCPADCGTGLA
jgi:hypothetical protein